MCRFLIRLVCGVVTVSGGLTFAVTGQSTTTYFAPDSQAYAQFGWAVAINHRTMAVSARLADGPDFNTGTVTVYRREAGGWTPEACLEAEGTILNDSLGESLALWRNWLVAGTRHTEGQEEVTGSAHVFRRRPDGWQEVARLAPPEAQVARRFGRDVDIERDTIVVGAPGEGLFVGAVYVYRRQGGEWVQSQLLVAPGQADLGQFGTSLSLEGDWLAVGTPWDGTAAFNAGAVHMYRRQADGDFAYETSVFTPTAAPLDEVGVAVELCGRTLAVGVPFQDAGIVNASGAVHLFEWDGEVWAWQKMLTAPDAGADAYYGGAVALTRSVLAVGSLNPSGPTGEHLGAVYVYTAEAGQWTLKTKVTPPPETISSEFGLAVDVWGSEIVAGAHRDDQVAVDGGAATVIDLGGHPTARPESHATRP